MKLLVSWLHGTNPTINSKGAFRECPAKLRCGKISYQKHVIHVIRASIRKGSEVNLRYTYTYTTKNWAVATWSSLSGRSFVDSGLYLSTKNPSKGSKFEKKTCPEVETVSKKSLKSLDFANVGWLAKRFQIFFSQMVVKNGESPS